MSILLTLSIILRKLSLNEVVFTIADYILRPSVKNKGHL